MEKILLGHKDFEKLFGEKLSDYVKEKTNKYEFAYSPITVEERDSALGKIIETITDPDLTYSGPHRLNQWEKGWGENLLEFNASKRTDDISPHYFGKYDIVRISRELVKVYSPHFERNALYAIVDHVFDKYLRKAQNIYEFGCGTGHILIKAGEVNPEANLFGLDWVESSRKIINEISKAGVTRNITSRYFDFFDPDASFQLNARSAVYTVMALEQVGEEYEKFIQYLLRNEPEICIHIEPIEELLEENHLLDKLSIKYSRKRNYLRGFLAYLKRLEEERKINIHEAKRMNIGNFFIENSSVVVWSPSKKYIV